MQARPAIEGEPHQESARKGEDSCILPIDKRPHLGQFRRVWRASSYETTEVIGRTEGNMNMRKAIMAAGLAAGLGMGTAQAAVLLGPGDSSFLSTDMGSGAGFTEWDGTELFWAVFDFSGTAYGYVVEDATDSVIAVADADAPPVHYGFTTNPVADNIVGNGVFYYLATSASALGEGDSIAGLTAYESERFELYIPEPSAYALLAGLGLVGFVGYRRFRD